MAVTPARQLERAKDLLQSDEESDWRMAAHSAYYACFSALKKVQKIEELPDFADVGTHQSLIDSLQSSKKNLLKRAAIILSSIRAQRVIADYCPDEDFTQTQAESVVGTAESIEKMISPEYKVFD